MYNYAEKDVRVLLSKRRYIHYYPEYLDKARKAGHKSLIEYVDALYDKYWSLEKVGMIVGVSRTTIKKWLIFSGRELRPRGGHTMLHLGKIAKGDEVLAKRIRSYANFLRKAEAAGCKSLNEWLHILLKKYSTITAAARFLGISDTALGSWLRIIQEES